MTAPLSGGGTRERLAEALLAWWGEEAGEPVNALDAARESAGQYAAALLPVVESIADERAAEAEERGYERGRRDFQFAPEGDNHHNAAMCPYCSPLRAATSQRETT